MLCIILVSTICFILNYGNCQFDPRIVNGYIAKPAEFPYMVSVLYQHQHVCGGSAISKNYVLTAAHCVIRNNQGMPVHLFSILAGQNRLDHNVSQRITCGIQQYFYPSDWMHNDIAILQLRQSLPDNNAFVTYIPLPRKPVVAGTTCIVSGWGYQKYNATELSRNLLAVNLTIIEFSQCSSKYRKINITLSKSFICAGDHNGDACQGDSGGPLVCDGFLTGIVSTGIECAHKYFPGIYTNVSQYVPWITNITNSTYIIQNNISNITTTIVIPTTFNIHHNYSSSTSNSVHMFIIIICILNIGIYLYFTLE